METATSLAVERNEVLVVKAPRPVDDGEVLDAFGGLLAGMGAGIALWVVLLVVILNCR